MIMDGTMYKTLYILLLFLTKPACTIVTKYSTHMQSECIIIMYTVNESMQNSLVSLYIKLVIPYKDSCTPASSLCTHSHIVADSLLFSVHCHHNCMALPIWIVPVPRPKWADLSGTAPANKNKVFTKLKCKIVSHQWQDIQVVCRWLEHQVIPSNHHTQYPTLSSDISLPCPPSTLTLWLAAGRPHWNMFQPIARCLRFVHSKSLQL